MPLKKVTPGNPLRIPADTFNAFIDAADAHRRGIMSLPGLDPGSIGPTGQIVVVQNASGSHQDRFAILAIDGIVISPTDNLKSFQTRPTFVVGPATIDSLKLVILQEPVATASCGRALIAGLSAVRINMIDPDHAYAKPTSGDSTQLTSSSGSGPFRILYAEPGTGPKWAAVLFPAGAGAPASYISTVTDCHPTDARIVKAYQLGAQSTVDVFVGAGHYFMVDDEILITKLSQPYQGCEYAGVPFINFGLREPPTGVFTPLNTTDLASVQDDPAELDQCGGPS